MWAQHAGETRSATQANSQLRTSTHAHWQQKTFSRRDEIDYVCAVEEMSFTHNSMVAFGVISLVHHFYIFLL